MKNKNELYKTYTEMPEKKNIRTFILAIAVFVNVCGYCSMKAYYGFVSNSTVSSSTITFLNALIIYFNLFSPIFYIFPIQLNKLIYLYTAIAFTGSSIFYFFISSLIFLSELDSSLCYLIIGICLFIYILIASAVIFNIKSKIKNGYRKRRVNTALAVTIGSICILIGILLSKQTHLKFHQIVLQITMQVYF